MQRGARIFFAFILGLAAAGVAGAAEWQRIEASAPFVDSDGIPRAPGCSAGPVPTPVGLQPADPDFAFFYRPGDPRKWVFGLDGGGACWDPNTCVGSALAGDPVYNLEVDETVEELAGQGGLGDRTNPANPVAGHSVVFIPYCTGDVHMGAQDTTYLFTAPDGTPVPWTIRHRGFDNVIAALEWASARFQALGVTPREVLWTGASAGGYGAQFAYPALHRRLPPGTRIRVLTDSANGIINQDFYDRALGPMGAWNVWQNVAPELVNALASGPEDLPVAFNQSLGWSYPFTRFGQYTRAYDGVQIFFFNVARNLDSPELWSDPLELLFAGLEWSLRARTTMALSALTTWNYRLYLGRGDGHTIIADDSFYTESSANGIPFSRWVDDMINRRFPFGGSWRNASCSPNCLP